MGDCPQRGKWFGRGCRFQGRYETNANSVEPLSVAHIEAVRALGNVFPSDDRAALEAIRGECGNAKRYIGDICIRCGKWVDKPNSSAPPASPQEQ